MGVRRPIFGIFEGGGAKGIAHVGALRSAEANNLEFMGVAGASAGAIVATLVAVGYSATDLVDPKTDRSDILSQHNQSPVGILGRDAWRQFVAANRTASRYGKGLLIGGAVLAWCCAPGASRVLAGIRRHRGHFSTDGLRQFVNEVLRHRLAELYADAGRSPNDVPKRVLFKHLDPAQFPQLRALKIVATDLGSRSLTVFDRTLTPEVEIAEAVAASIAIPLVFRPVSIGSYKGGAAGPFVDGGLISNSPIWVFAEEKLAFERANPTQPSVPIVSFTLVEKTASDAPPLGPRASTLVDFVATVARTAIFGSQAISQRFIEDVLIVPLQTELGLLDFDAGWDTIRTAYTDGRLGAAQHLKFALTVKPDLVRTELERVRDIVRSAVDVARARNGKGALSQSRAALVERFGATSFRVTAALNMDGDADDRLTLDSRGRGAPEAHRSRSPVLVQVDQGRASAEPSYMTKYEAALVRPRLRSIVCVPIFKDLAAWAQSPADRPEPLGLFCFDSDEDLADAFGCDDVQRILAGQTVVLSSIFQRS